MGRSFFQPNSFLSLAVPPEWRAVGTTADRDRADRPRGYRRRSVRSCLGDTPYAGAKQSGIGTEPGREGLEEFTQATVINMSK
jgi:hypothetical protein